MGSESLSIRGFRCFTGVELDLSPRLNVVQGTNASGKTSILEALYLLSRGRSFRAAQLATVVQHGCDMFLLNAQVNSAGAPVEISLAKGSRALEARVSGTPVHGLYELATVFPVQLLDGQANQLIHGGPRSRRQFLDWGTFHVEPHFYQTWGNYYRTLRHRNSLLKTRASKREVETWDAELARYGEELSRSRQRYLDELGPGARRAAEQALDGVAVTLEYKRGWPNQMPLAEALQTVAGKDFMLGITHAGPHRADLAIRVNDAPAQDVLSRGQEKALATALLLAQAELYQRHSGLSCTLLIDDLAAELDSSHLGRLLQRIDEVGAQVVMTVVDAPATLKLAADRMFHVKQGLCSRMV